MYVDVYTSWSEYLLSPKTHVESEAQHNGVRRWASEMRAGHEGRFLHL